ncbi:MAG TPA: DUF433 domain-containing protein [Anaerolineae bacterium]
MSLSTLATPHTTRHPYIARRKAVCGGKPTIAGTRIKVTQIAIEYERMGWTPDQIVDAHPHLRLAQVHDALSYYYENQKQLDAEILADERFVAELRRHYSARSATAYGH